VVCCFKTVYIHSIFGVCGWREKVGREADDVIIMLREMKRVIEDEKGDRKKNDWQQIVREVECMNTITCSEALLFFHAVDKRDFSLVEIPLVIKLLNGACPHHLILLFK